MKFEFLLPRFTLRRRTISSLLKILKNKDCKFKNIFNKINYQNSKKYNNIFECNICGAIGKPYYDWPDIEMRNLHMVGLLRETLNCKECGSSVRDRSLALKLLEVVNKKIGSNYRMIKQMAYGGIAGIQILDTDAFSPISNIMNLTDGYIRSSFIPDKCFDSELSNNYFNINLENVNINKIFDIVITSDVMEHVRDYNKAHREIFKILKKDGVYIFTVPNSQNMKKNLILVDTSGEVDRLLVNKAHYHGDPLTGGIISYRVFGKEIFSDFHNIDMNLTLDILNKLDHMVINGDVFSAIKN